MQELLLSILELANAKGFFFHRGRLAEARFICCEVWSEEEEESSYSGLVISRLLWVHQSRRCGDKAKDERDGRGAVIL